MTKQQDRLHKRACGLLGLRPDAVRCVGPTEWRAITGWGVSRNKGFANQNYVRSKGQEPVIYVRRGEGLDTYIHELLHHVFPNRTHAWIFGAAWKLAGVKQASYRYGYGSGLTATTETRIESKAKLLALAHAAIKQRGWEG